MYFTVRCVAIHNAYAHSATSTGRKKSSLNHISPGANDGPFGEVEIQMSEGALRRAVPAGISELLHGQGSKSVLLYGDTTAAVNEMDFPTGVLEPLADVRIFVADAKTQIVAADGINRGSAKKHGVAVSKSGRAGAPQTSAPENAFATALIGCACSGESFWCSRNQLRMMKKIVGAGDHPIGVRKNFGVHAGQQGRS